MIIEKQPVTTNYQYNQIGHFKELTAGAGTKVFKVNTSGVFAGSSSYGSAPFRLSYSGALYASSVDIIGKITATSGSFSGTLDAASGTFSGQLVAATGSVSGDFLVSGSLYSDSSGWRTKLSDGQVEFLKSGTSKGFMRYSIGNDGIQIASSENIFLVKASGTPIVTISQTGGIDINSDSYIRWAGGRGVTAVGDRLSFNGSISPDGQWNRDCGTPNNKWNYVRGANIAADTTFFCQNETGVNHAGYGFVDSLRWKSGTLQARWTEIRMRGGIITNLNQSGYENV
jgi:hypothetical protein